MKKRKPYHKIVKCPSDIYKCSADKCPFANETEVGTICNILKHRLNGKKFKVTVREII